MSSFIEIESMLCYLELFKSLSSEIFEGQNWGFGIAAEIGTVWSVLVRKLWGGTRIINECDGTIEFQKDLRCDLLYLLIWNS